MTAIEAIPSRTRIFFRRSRLPIILTGVIALTLVTFANCLPAELSHKYSGILTHGEFISCSGQVLDPPAYSVTGTWVLYIDPITQPQVPPPAHITMKVFRDGKEYLTFDYVDLTPISVADGVYTYSAIGNDVKATLDTRRKTTPTTFSWEVQFHDTCTQRSYRSLTYAGRTDEGAK